MIELSQSKLKEMFSLNVKKESGGIEEIEQVHIMFVEKTDDSNETGGDVQSIRIVLTGKMNRLMISEFDIVVPEKDEVVLKYYQRQFPNMDHFYQYTQKCQKMSESEFLMKVGEKNKNITTKIKNWSIYDFKSFKQMIINYNSSNFYIILDSKKDNMIFRFDNCLEKIMIQTIDSEEFDFYQSNIKIATQNQCGADDDDYDDDDEMQE